jgi:hypothetical protein
MRLLILIVIGVIGASLAFFVRRNADAREEAILRDLDGALLHPGDSAHPGLVQTIKANTRYMASIVRSLVLFTIIVVVGGFGALAWLQDISTSQQGEIARSCASDREFRRLIEAQLVEDLRVLRSDRDHLADEIATESDEFTGLPEFAGLPEPVQAFLSSLIAAQTAEAKEHLDDLDGDIAVLVGQVDAIRAFNLDADCPEP